MRYNIQHNQFGNLRWETIAQADSAVIADIIAGNLARPGLGIRVVEAATGKILGRY